MNDLRTTALARKRATRVAIIGTALGAASLLHAGPAHEHGVLRLEVTVAPGGISLRLESALDNLVGFEHAPRTDSERAMAAAALIKLTAASVLFKVDAAALCDAGRSQVDVPLWQAAAAKPQAGQAAPPAAAGHGDLDASYEFKCKSAASAQTIETTLFSTFPRLKRIEVQMVTPRGQSAVVLKPGQTRMLLKR